MDAEPAPPDAARQKAQLAAIDRAVAERRAAFHESKDEAARGPLFDALMAMAGEAFRAVNDEAVITVLTEAEAVLPTPLPDETPWRARAMNLHRAKGAVAQKQGRSADAVAAFETAIATLPPDAEGDRDALAARLQLLVRMGRSRLAIGQASETEAEMIQCGSIIESLGSAIPSRALDTVRAAVLSHSGAALALLGKHDGAEEKFKASLALIDQLDSPDLASLRQRVTALRADMLSKAGKATEAQPLIAVSGGQPRDASSDHDHDHAHSDHH
jgi:tetratricopeptide (TPR) repeat protein